MELIEHLFNDGTAASLEARTYLNQYMERARDFFEEELLASERVFKQNLIDPGCSPAGIDKSFYMYERKRAIFVERIIFGKTFREIGEQFGISVERCRGVFIKECRRLKRSFIKKGFAKSLQDKTIMMIFVTAYSDKEDWSDWLDVRKPRDFLYM